MSDQDEIEASRAPLIAPSHRFDNRQGDIP